MLLAIINILMIGIIGLILIPEQAFKTIRYWSFLISLVVLAATFILLLGFDKAVGKFQFLTEINWWLNEYNINFMLGVDGISILFVTLTAIIMTLCVLGGWSIQVRIKYFYLILLILELLIILVFTVLDIVLFYIVFEATLIPMYLIILEWGPNERKIKAGVYLFIYTFIGSIFLLISIFLIYLEVGTTNYLVLLNVNFSFTKQIILWNLFFVSFAIKIPMFPVHLWLPEAHVEAPTVGSVILAALLLKLGGYGFLRFPLPICPLATQYLRPVAYTICIVSIVFASSMAVRQVDLKRIIAYSSIAHMNYAILGLFTLTSYGIIGGIILMLAHGISSAALFFIVGCLYDRYHSRLVKYYGGLVYVMPLFIVIFFFFTVTNFSLPGTFNFIGEILIFLGLAKVNSMVLLIAVPSTFIGTAYCILICNKISFGSLKTQYNTTFSDLSRREYLIFLTLIIITLLGGFFPNYFFDIMHASVKILLQLSL
jgi:proton-translocating NADH-quinone oxidoreductase chain M